MLRCQQVVGDVLRAVGDAALNQLAKFLIGTEFVRKPDLPRHRAVLHHARVVLPVADGALEYRVKVSFLARSVVVVTSEVHGVFLFLRPCDLLIPPRKDTVQVALVASQSSAIPIDGATYTAPSPV